MTKNEDVDINPCLSRNVPLWLILIEHVTNMGNCDDLINMTKSDAISNHDDNAVLF